MGSAVAMNDVAVDMDLLSKSVSILKVIDLCIFSFPID
jgi:hypothetical protein